MPTKRSVAKVTAIEPVTNDAEQTISFSEPYTVSATIVGTAPFLFHRWSVEDVEVKTRASKGSRAKRTDNLEAYVYRTPTGQLAIPSEYIRQAIIHAAKYQQDPRSPRKSAMDLFTAGIVTVEPLCDLGTNAWDFVDQRRVMIQRNAITRNRPAMEVGWEVEVLLMVLLPEYIQSSLLHETLSMAGMLIGIGNFRPSYGRYRVVKFTVLEQE